MYQDPEIAGIIRNLDRKKQDHVNGKKAKSKTELKNFFCEWLDENFDQARKFKQAIQELLKVGQ